jgi:O-antigen/teichoic acid export membrane protein
MLAFLGYFFFAILVGGMFAIAVYSYLAHARRRRRHKHRGSKRVW